MEYLDVLNAYEVGLGILDDYDHQTLKQPEDCTDVKRLTYEEAIRIVALMREKHRSDVFGIEKDQSLRSSLNTIYQGYGGEFYPGVLNKAVHLLYFLVKNHPFVDGNKRIAAGLFLCFLDMNGVLYDKHNQPIISNKLLALLTVYIAESRAENKDMVCLFVRSLLNGDI